MYSKFYQFMQIFLSLFLLFHLLSCSEDRSRLSSIDNGLAEAKPAQISPYFGSYSITNEITGTKVAVTVENGTRIVISNGLPNYEIGQFPNAGNPNSVSPQNYVVSLPTQPEMSASLTPYNVPQSYGIATNGIVLDPFAAEWYNDNPDSGWQLAALAHHLGFNQHNAHVQLSGAYHYHGGPTPLLSRTDKPELIGFAGDGLDHMDTLRLLTLVRQS